MTTNVRDGWKKRGVEWTMLPTTIDELAELHDELKRMGKSDQLTNGLVGWLMAQATGRDTTKTSPVTAASYRKILGEVAKRRRRRVGATAHNPRGVGVMSGGREFTREPELVGAAS